ncbi:MAG: electron transfer flavoprotein-ubiquinone oxidoreductase [Acidobacteriota bacterium]|nr:electron transfer flavoprotein-ubiquinone oxidoreductase [Acidobacteriota bacterium]MDH3530260.1 electron transfer flavoprotein-ubiquinone oxidoreductase [Acidobacteriota bacterium]
MTEREQLEMDIVFVGAGPANLSAAYHLKKLIDEHDEAIKAGTKEGDPIGEIEIGIIEKGPRVGAHVLSGAVMDPKALRELMPDFLDQGCPIDTVTTEDAFWYLTENKKIKAPITPPPLVNKGKYIVSLSKVCEWLGEKCEEIGINIFPEFPGSEMLYDDEDNVIGVRTGDKGVDKEGKPKGNFEPGIDLIAQVTVLGEGSRGSLTKSLTERLGLNEGKEPQVFSLGAKELWEIPEGNLKEGTVIHTLGFPSDTQTYGGGWIYGMKDNIVSIGYVTGLDYLDPGIDPHAEFQKFKTHPEVRKILEGGKMIKYGAKTINAGGFYTMPKLFANGVLLVGDCASFLNGQRIKGIHTAMKGGMLAAETILIALQRKDFSEKTLRYFERKVNGSWIYDELYAVRNFHSAFQRGRWSALLNTGLQFLTGGMAWGFMPKDHHVAGHQRMEKVDEYAARGKNGDRYSKLQFDKEITFDKVTDVFHASVGHDEDQPSHLHVMDTDICATRCTEEYGNPCEQFCPAAVYEMEEDSGSGRKELRVNFSNCVHCKTCDIMDPYQIINWVTPEGGGGPDYKGM